MKSFETNTLAPLPLTHNVVRTTARLHEHLGREALYAQQAPQVLRTLREVAVIQSTESSNRIEGVVAPPERLRALVRDKTKPRNRSEQEITGYRDVLGTIHASHAAMPFTPGLVLQLHRDLFRYTDAQGGAWKSTNNTITERHPDGTEVVRFETVPAFQTAAYMEQLHRRFEQLWKDDTVDRLLLIAAYVLDFLCVHPFLDGNGRMARLLTLLLLYRAGYGVGRYISLERVVEDSRESYYDTLYQSSQGWHEGKHTLLPWTEYFLGVLTAAYKDFESRVGTMQMERGAKTEQVRSAVDRLPDGFKTKDVGRLCPSVSRSLIRKVFSDLKAEGLIRAEGRGPAAVWRKVGLGAGGNGSSLDS